MKILTEKDYKEMSWKNGNGQTKELIRIPHPSNPELFSLRLSIANMTGDGPFSHYPGIERTIILLQGSGIVLDFVDEIKMMMNERLKPIQFAGEAEIEGKLIDGPIFDFNIMAARDTCDAFVEVHQKINQIHIGSEDEHYCYVLEGTGESREIALSPNQLIIIKPGERISLSSKNGLTLIDVKIKKAR